jgi:hypothetical protein
MVQLYCSTAHALLQIHSKLKTTPKPLQALSLAVATAAGDTRAFSTTSTHFEHADSTAASPPAIMSFVYHGGGGTCGLNMPARSEAAAE